MRFRAFFALAAVAACVSDAAAVDLYDTLGKTIAASGNFGSNTRGGISFKTTLAGDTITSVTVPILNDLGLTSGSVLYSIYDATGTGGRPGNQVGADLGSIPISNFTSTSVYQNGTLSGLNFVLNPDTFYYLVVSGSGLSGSFKIAATTDSSGIGAGSLGYSQTNAAGTIWNAVVPAAYGIASITAVPEPSTLVMGAIAALSLGLTAWRNKKRLSTAACTPE